MTTPTINTPATTTTTPPKTPEAVDYANMSADAIAKLINEEYGWILSSERRNLQKAKTIGEHLTWLRARAKHGEWQDKLAVWCPKLDPGVAVRYIRLFENWELV